MKYSGVPGFAVTSSVTFAFWTGATKAESPGRSTSRPARCRVS